MFPTFIIEENAVFQIDVSENKGLCLSLSKCTIPEFSAWTFTFKSHVPWCVHMLKGSVCACMCAWMCGVCVFECGGGRERRDYHKQSRGSERMLGREQPRNILILSQWRKCCSGLTQLPQKMCWVWGKEKNSPFKFLQINLKCLCRTKCLSP